MGGFRNGLQASPVQWLLMEEITYITEAIDTMSVYQQFFSLIPRFRKYCINNKTNPFNIQIRNSSALPVFKNYERERTTLYETNDTAVMMTWLRFSFLLLFCKIPNTCL